MGAFHMSLYMSLSWKQLIAYLTVVHLYLLNRTVLAWNANLKNDTLSVQSFHRTKNSCKSYADQLKAALQMIYVKGNS